MLLHDKNGIALYKPTINVLAKQIINMFGKQIVS